MVGTSVASMGSYSPCSLDTSRPSMMVCVTVKVARRLEYSGLSVSGSWLRVMRTWLPDPAGAAVGWLAAAVGWPLAAVGLLAAVGWPLDGGAVGAAACGAAGPQAASSAALRRTSEPRRRNIGSLLWPGSVAACSEMATGAGLARGPRPRPRPRKLRCTARRCG